MGGRGRNLRDSNTQKGEGRGSNVRAKGGVVGRHEDTTTWGNEAACLPWHDEPLKRETTAQLQQNWKFCPPSTEAGGADT